MLDDPSPDQRQAFTLIELLVVIAIIAILCSIAFSVWQSMIKRSKEKSCAANLHSIFLASELYASDHDNSFPIAVSWLQLKPACSHFYGTENATADITQVLGRYVNGPLWHCPLDHGIVSGLGLEPAECATELASGSAFISHGSSYGYRYEDYDVNRALAWDLSGIWHGAAREYGMRFNTVFLDGSVKLLKPSEWNSAR